MSVATEMSAGGSTRPSTELQSSAPEALPRRPVFLFGFTRGGTNIAMNLLLSHPEICGVRGELREVFAGKHIRNPVARRLRRWRYRRMCRREGYDVFSLRRAEPPPHWSEATREEVRRILVADPLEARGAPHNRYRAPGIEYSSAEIRRARLACKAPDGLAFLSDELEGAFPRGARFIALVRNGYAVCEGKLRRGRDLEQAAKEYHAVCQRMLADAERCDRYGILRFEDILRQPRESLDRLLRLAGEDPAGVEQVRLQQKAFARPDGCYAQPAEGKDRAVVWYPLDGFETHLEPSVDASQMARLDAAQRATIARLAGESLERLGYAPR